MKVVEMVNWEHYVYYVCCYNVTLVDKKLLEYGEFIPLQHGKPFPRTYINYSKRRKCSVLQTKNAEQRTGKFKIG